jgi:flavin reductase (DIM6/NTAB) family NADH-FMN oxidoreductase RutF
MNYSAAPLPEAESEFAVAGLVQREATLVDAPTVADSPLVFECRCSL